MNRDRVFSILSGAQPSESFFGVAAGSGTTTIAGIIPARAGSLIVVTSITWQSYGVSAVAQLQLRFNDGSSQLYIVGSSSSGMHSITNRSTLLRTYHPLGIARSALDAVDVVLVNSGTTPNSNVVVTGFYASIL